MLNTLIPRFLIKSGELLNKNFPSTPSGGASRHKGGCSEWHVNHSEPSAGSSDVVTDYVGIKIRGEY